jgi:amidase
MREVGGADFIQALSGFMTLANTLDAEGYARALAQRTRVIREWLVFLETYPLIVAPVSSRKTPSWNYDLGGDEAVRSFFWNDFRFTSGISVLGLPAAATPIGLADDHPVGVQLIASRFREDVCLDAAAAIEARVGILAHSLWARG